VHATVAVTWKQIQGPKTDKTPRPKKKTKTSGCDKLQAHHWPVFLNSRQLIMQSAASNTSCGKKT